MSPLYHVDEILSDMDSRILKGHKQVIRKKRLNIILID